MAQKLYSWESNLTFFETYEKNIIEDDIIPDEDIENLKNFIKSYCNANYNGYKATGNSGYSVETVDGSGPSDCNGCDTTVNCYPANGADGGCEKQGLYGQAQSACSGGSDCSGHKEGNGHWSP